jgi:hypothetical protein
VARVTREQRREEALRTRMSEQLTEIANALHGGPLRDGYWSWHDLPARTRAAMRELRAWRKAYAASSTDLAASLRWLAEAQRLHDLNTRRDTRLRAALRKVRANGGKG